MRCSLRVVLRPTHATAACAARVHPKVLEMEQRDRLKIAAAAQRRAATLFSTERFEASFLEAITPVLPKA